MQPNTLDAYIADAIADRCEVLDLGCGDGSLLAYLRNTKQAKVQGVEMDFDKVAQCIERDIPVMQANLDHGLSNITDNSYDVVVLSQTLQVVHNPALVVREIMRISRIGVITFPNFGHWSTRFHLLLRGRMPVSRLIPYSWDETPNIHHTTLKDFVEFVERNNATVKDIKPLRATTNGNQRMVKLAPNLLAETIFAIITRK